MNSSNLRTENITKRFGGLVALENVSIEVPSEKIIMLIGPNGSGKTTLINVISGVYKPEKGKVFFDKNEITGLPPHKVYSLGIVRTFQIPSLFLKLTVLENLVIAAKNQIGEKITEAILNRRKWIKQEEKLIEKAFEILDLLTLSHMWNRRASELSGGQMKLLEIGRALMSDPKVILMDEPVAGVNPKLAHNIMNHVTGIRDKLGLSFLIVEHRLDIVLDYVDYVYAMHRGKVISKGSPDEVISDPVVIESYLGG